MSKPQHLGEPPTAESGGGNSFPQGVLDGLREPEGKEVFGGVKIVLAGFVDDPGETFLERGVVREHLVDLPELQVFAIIVSNADDESTFNFGSLHDSVQEPLNLHSFLAEP
ncbi:MAG: hypothetical protein AABY65_10450 [Nitrospirota bacterium]